MAGYCAYTSRGGCDLSRPCLPSIPLLRVNIAPAAPPRLVKQIEAESARWLQPKCRSKGIELSSLDELPAAKWTEKACQSAMAGYCAYTSRGGCASNLQTLLISHLQRLLVWSSRLKQSRLAGFSQSVGEELRQGGETCVERNGYIRSGNDEERGRWQFEARHCRQGRTPVNIAPAAPPRLVKQIEAESARWLQPKCRSKGIASKASLESR
jgi:hypothetical protein